MGLVLFAGPDPANRGRRPGLPLDKVQRPPWPLHFLGPTRRLTQLAKRLQEGCPSRAARREGAHQQGTGCSDWRGHLGLCEGRNCWPTIGLLAPSVRTFIVDHLSRHSRQDAMCGRRSGQYCLRMGRLPWTCQSLCRSLNIAGA